MVAWSPPVKKKTTNQELASLSKELLLEWMDAKSSSPATTWSEGDVRNIKEILRVALQDGVEGELDIIEDVPLDNLLDLFNAEKTKTQ